MTFSLLWLPQVLRDAGLNVIEVPGWQNRGHGDEGNVLGVICHHTCGPLHGDLPDLNVLKDGRPDLGGPLCQLGLGREGTYYVIAAGKAWHAGRGEWQGVTDGNAHFIGIEAENTGEIKGARADHWPEVQMDAYRRGVAAILKHVGAKPIMCAGHKEFALPKGRKDDPNFDMVKFRADVDALMKGTKSAQIPIPPAPKVNPKVIPKVPPPDVDPVEPKEKGLSGKLKHWLNVGGTALTAFVTALIGGDWRAVTAVCVLGFLAFCIIWFTHMRRK